MSKTILVFILSCIFFALTPRTVNYSDRPFWYKGLPIVSSWIKKVERKRAINFSEQEAFNLWSAYLFGKTKKVSNKIREAHNILHLQHLFSPSGLHLSLIQMVFPKILFPFIILGCFSLPAMMALKRMALIKSCHFFSKNFKFILFLMCMFLELCLNSFQSNLSFNFSFIFLGIIYSRESWHLSSLLYWIFLGNIFCYMMLAKLFSIVGFLLGQIILIIFTPLFLLQTIILVLPWKLFVFCLEKYSQVYIVILNKLASIANFFPVFIPNFSIFLAFLLILYKPTRTWSYLLFLLNTFTLS